MIADHRNTLETRELSETLLNRAQFLEPADRALLEQVLEKGVRPRDIARVAGTSTRTIQRRVRNLMRRLADPDVLYVLRQHRGWSAPLRQVALALWVRRRTLRQTAAELGLSLHRVRQHAAAVRGLIEQGRAPQNGPPAQRSAVR